jgi:voltage-gated potassium channel Kch
MATLVGVLSLLLSFFHDIGEILRDPKTRVILIWVLLLLLIGTLFYALVEGWTYTDAFYFSVITLSTVGYGDLSPVTTVGKLFTAVYILVGISIIVVFANTLAKKHAHRIAAQVSRVPQNEAGPGASDGSVDGPAS